jgi:hypothetical protein
VTFRRSDVKRAILAVKEAKLDIERIVIENDGKIIVFPAKSGDQKTHPSRSVGDLDGWLAKKDK